jgi:hypothetical protein
MARSAASINGHRKTNTGCGRRPSRRSVRVSNRGRHKRRRSDAPVDRFAFFCGLMVASTGTAAALTNEEIFRLKVGDEAK